MSWRGAVKSFVSSGAFLSMIGGIGASGVYVVYTDSTRYTRMSATFARGNILPPLAENDYEVAYARRPTVEDKVRAILTPTFCNEYYIVQGPVGVGKTRLIAQITQEMIKTRGSQNVGAPVYVLATQGRSFPETLANAVNFHFDEHVSFRFFLNYVLGIRSVPSKDDDNKIVRVLDAIEKSSFDYLTETGRPLVLVIDGLDDIAKKSPSIVKMIQEKAKLWADTNSVKVVFVCNTEDTELLLQSNNSNWSRASSPILLSDLSKSEAIQFLKSNLLMEKSQSNNMNEMSYKRTEGMPLDLAEKVYDHVGGRIRHLVLIKRGWLEGQEFDAIKKTLMEREREKFVSVTNHSAAWTAIGLIRDFKSERGIDINDCSEQAYTNSKNLKSNSDGLLGVENEFIPILNVAGLKGSIDASDGVNSNDGFTRNVDDEHSEIICFESSIHASEGSGYLLSKLVKKTSKEVVRDLIKAGLLRCERRRLGVIVKFESRLTENVIDDLEITYRNYKAERKQKKEKSIKS